MVLADFGDGLGSGSELGSRSGSRSGSRVRWGRALGHGGDPQGGIVLEGFGGRSTTRLQNLRLGWGSGSGLALALGAMWSGIGAWGMGHCDMEAPDR